MLRNRLIAVLFVTIVMLALIPLAAFAAPSATPQADDKASPAPAEVVSANLLANPGLEGSYHQQCSLKSDPPWVPAPFYCDPADYDTASLNLWATAQVPDGWAAWWRVPNDNYDDPNYYNSYPHSCQPNKQHMPIDCKPWHNPEFRDTAGGPQETGPKRRMEGENSQKYFTFYTVHEAGLYQIVPNIKPGSRLRFSIYMMAWSSQYNDSFRSDSQPTMGMKVGIDPWGGNDPWSSNIVWSDVKESWDQFSQLTVEAVAKNSIVSVWTRSQPFFAIQHNDVYVDAGSLVVVRDAPKPRPAASRPVTRTVTITSTKVTTRTVGTRVITSTVTVTSTKIVTSTTPVSTKPITSTKPVTSTKPATSTTTTSKLVTGTQVIPASGIYMVVRGDTLIAIARRFGITPWWRLGELNNLKEPYKIEVGQKLKLK